MSIGTRIQRAITDGCGNNASELARACGVKPSAVYQWVRDETKPNCINIFFIEAKTGFSARWIALGEGSEKLDPSKVTFITKDESDPLFEKIKDADDRLKRAVENLLDQAQR